MNRLRTRRGVMQLTAALILSLAGFGLSRTAEADSSSVTIQNFAFNPGTTTIPVGSTVTWTNQDSVAHTATSDDSSAVSWDSGALSTGGKYSFTFTQAGTFAYHCAIHPYMHGTIVVQGSGSSGATPTAVPTAASTAVSNPTSVPPTALPTATAAPTQGSTGGTKGAKHTIAARPKGQSFAFSPTSTSVKVGTKVTWVNQSQAPHTVTSKVKSWKFNKSLNKKKVSFTFKKAGTYLYYCKFHPGMKGKIVVKK